MKITTIGLDLAKNVFQVHGVDAAGKVVLTRQLKRSQVLPFFARVEPCLVGMEACAGAHYWARALGSHGHTIRLMAPQFVKPYLKANKNDARDAEAICEAVTRPTMRFVAVKSVDQQAVLSLHRIRDGLVASRTALINQLRGLLAEFGVVIPQGRSRLEGLLPAVIQDTDNVVPTLLKSALSGMRDHLLGLNARIAELEGQIKAWHHAQATSRELARVPGIGPLTATATVATTGDARVFGNSRAFAAWLGIVPGQHSSGGKERLLGITKRGDGYLRKLFIHGARAVVSQHRPGKDVWLDALLARRPRNVAIVAVAHRNARIAWALMAHQGTYHARTQ